MKFERVFVVACVVMLGAVSPAMATGSHYKDRLIQKCERFLDILERSPVLANFVDERYTPRRKYLRHHQRYLRYKIRFCMELISNNEEPHTPSANRETREWVEAYNRN